MSHHGIAGSGNKLCFPISSLLGSRGPGGDAVCAVFMGELSTLPVDFLEFLPRNRNHHHFSDDVGGHELLLVCHCEVGHCEVEDEDAAGGFPPWRSVVPPSSLTIDMVIEVFSSFELLILSSTLFLFWTYRSQ